MDQTWGVMPMLLSNKNLIHCREDHRIMNDCKRFHGLRDVVGANPLPDSFPDQTFTA